MTTDAARDEPTAEASPEERRHFVMVAALFLAGPVIWISYFMAVYLLGEALCAAGAERQLFGLHILSTLTLAATIVAIAVTALPTGIAYRRWRASGVGWNGSVERRALSDEEEQEGRLALAGFLLGGLFLGAILFVGLPAFVFAC